MTVGQEEIRLFKQVSYQTLTVTQAINNIWSINITFRSRIEIIINFLK